MPTMARRLSTTQELRSQANHASIVSESAMTSIVHQDKVRRKLARASASPDLALLALDLSNEVGKSTPPITIYKPDPKTGDLILKETVTAITFRRRALESIAGKRFQQRISELQRKRQRAGQRQKAKSRAARVRLGKAAAAL